MSEIRSVSVHLDADVASYVAKMRLAGAETDKAFGSAGRSIDTTNSKLGETETALGKVDAQARRVETSMRRVGATTRRAGESDFSKATSRVDSFLGKLGLIPAVAIAGGAALVPLAAAATGVVAAFAAPIAFAGGGLTLFGLLGGAAIKQTQDQYKAIDQLGTKLAGLTKGTAAYAQVQQQLAVAQKAISPQQQAFHNALEGIQSDFADFIRGPAGQDLLGPFTQGLKLADDLLPKTAPVIHTVSGALSDLLGEFDRYAQSPGFSKLEHDIVGQIGPDIRGFGHILGDVTPGLAHLLVLLGKRLSPELMGEVERLAQDFDHWASSKGARKDVEGFIRYFNEVGPEAAHTIAAVARALAHVVDAVAPLGPDVLFVIRGLASGLSKIPIPVLTALAGTAAALVTLQKVGGFKALSLAGNALGGASGGGGVTGAVKGIVGGGVQKVYVVNWGHGGPGGGLPGGGPGGGPGEGSSGGNWVTRFLGRAAPFGAGAAGLTIGGTVAAAAAGAAAGLGAAKVYADNHYNVLLNGPLGLNTLTHAFSGHNLIPGPDPTGYFNRYNPFSGGSKSTGAPQIKATTTAVDTLRAHLFKASRDMDLVGHSADRAFGGGAKDVERLGGQLNAIKGGPAAQQLELIGTAADRGFTRGTAGADNLQHHVDGLHGKQIDVKVNGGQSLAVLREIAGLEAALRSKTITITTQRVTGGHVTGGADGGTIGGAPRMPYFDKVLIAAAPGEEIISNRHGQADAYRADRRAGRIRGYSGGGTVGIGGGTVPIMGDGATGQPAHLTAIMRVRIELHKLELGLKSATTELDKDRAARQALIAKRQQVAATIRDSMRSQLFGVAANSSTTSPISTDGIWGAPVPTTTTSAETNPLKILRSDIHDARKFKHTIASLRRRGLSGAVVSQITDLADAQQVAGMSDHELHELKILYARRQRLTQAAGASAGDLAYGKQIAAQTKIVHAQAQDVHDMKRRIAASERHLVAIQKAIEKSSQKTGDAVGKQINNSATTATKRRRPR